MVIYLLRSSSKILSSKDIEIDRIGKESNNFDEVSVLGLDKYSYLEYENLREYYDCILKLKPKDVRDEGISKRTLWNIKHKIRNKKISNTNQSL